MMSYKKQSLLVLFDTATYGIIQYQYCKYQSDTSTIVGIDTIHIT